MSYNSPFTGNVVQPTDVSYRSITISTSVQLEWPINGNATDDYAARIMQVTATGPGLELRMPPANQTSVGNDALIRNVGAESFGVTDYNGDNMIVTVAPGEAAYIYITSNPDEQGTWGVIDFGVGSSSVDAATLQGYGILAIGSTLNQCYEVNTFSNPATADSTFRAQTWVWTGGAGTLTLSNAVDLGNNWFALLKNAGTGQLTLAASGGELIDGSSVLSIQPNESTFVVCSGTGFYTVGFGRSTEFVFTQLSKIVTNGTYTLTASEASNVVQTYTGVLTGNVTIVVPPVVQVYYVSNQTTAGGFTLTFTTNVGGGTDYTLPVNEQSILICDTVNVLNANSSISAVTSLGLGNGTAANPALYFNSETNTGIFRQTAGKWNVSILGTERLEVNATGIEVAGAGTFTSGITGGTFT